MKVLKIIFNLAVVLFMLLSPLSAKVVIFQSGDDLKIWLSGELTARYEGWNWFDPADKNNTNNNYGYYFTRSRLGIGCETDRLDVFVQAQHTRMWNLPYNSIAQAPEGTLGIGAIYYAHRGKENYYNIFIKQGFIRFKNFLQTGISLKAGRFEYIDAMEVEYNNPKVMWLKKIRLAERLIGPFGWSAFTRSFDGVELVLDKTKYNITAMASYPTQGGFENDVQHQMDDITLVSATLTVKYNQLIPHTESRLFYFFYDDDRDIPKVDNTPAGSGLNKGEIEVHTLGFHLLNTLDTGPGVADFLLWGVYQFGDWGKLEHKAWALDVEAGFQFIRLPAKPWLRMGCFVSSGDSSPSDGDHETFYQLIPTARKYALSPFYNLMNNEDFFLQLILKPHKKLLIRADMHFLRLNDSSDMWYMGAGPTRESGKIFGYIGRPSFGSADLAEVLDIMVVFTFNKHVSFNAYYGHVWGDDVIENIYRRDDDADMLFIEMGLKF